MLFEFLAARSASPIALATINCVPAGAGAGVFRVALREHVRPRAAGLGEDDRRRIEENPLRLFDSKDPEIRSRARRRAARRSTSSTRTAARSPCESQDACSPTPESRSPKAPPSCAASITTPVTVFEVVSGAPRRAERDPGRRALRQSLRRRWEGRPFRPSVSRSARTGCGGPAARPAAAARPLVRPARIRRRVPIRARRRAGRSARRIRATSSRRTSPAAASRRGLARASRILEATGESAFAVRRCASSSAARRSGKPGP